MPTAIWHLLLGPGSAHCDLALAVKVRRDLALAVEVRYLLLGSGSAHLALAVEAR